ncbi:MAG: NAD(+)/NADH kinase [Acidimicrobiales bacterium]
MAVVAVLVNPARGEARRLLEEIGPWLASRGHEARVLRLPDADRASGRVPGGELDHADLAGADLAVSLGGDGTFLRLVPMAYAAGVPVLGVNFGRLGYLLEVEPGGLTAALARTLAGDVTIEERVALAVSVDGSLEPAAGDDRSLEAHGSRWWVALNEMVTEKTVPGHMVHLTTAIDGEQCLTYLADGVLVATPTGSTAYNLSAGGPVLAAGMRAMVLTPVAPHLSIDRSLVLPPDQEVTVRVDGGRPAVLVVDGREVGRLSPGAEVRCRVAPEPVRLVTLGERGFAGLLRRTLTLDARPDA